RHETQVWAIGECDLSKHFTSCTKNPDHKRFIPINQFTLEHLPDGYRDEDTFQYIKTKADLTVRVAVTAVSPDRPEFWLGSHDPYPFYQCGENIHRSGTGEMNIIKFVDGKGFDARGNVYNVLDEQYGRDYKVCTCEQCQKLCTKKTEWWEITVHTAAHVVFDELEAKHTSCRLFFDEEDCLLVILENARIDYVNMDRDVCVLKFATHDQQLEDKLVQLVRRSADLSEKLLEKYRSSQRTDDKFNFIVSHPHGCFKQVSIGEWIENLRIMEGNEKYDFTKLTYTTATCLGSSGAMVYCLGIGTHHIHCGTYGSTNYSGVCVYHK
ncbi:RNA polymerase II-associated protein 3, partial [Biomphalaria glabrata]